MEDLELGEDIYCLAFITLLKSRNTVVHREMILKAGLCFLIQIMLSLVVWRGSADFN